MTAGRAGGDGLVGQQVTASAARAGVAVQTEMGGQNAAVVLLPDANTVPGGQHDRRRLQGFCRAELHRHTPDRGRWPGARQREVRDALVTVLSAVERLTVGDPAKEAVQAGPVVNEVAGPHAGGGGHVRVAGGRMLTDGVGVERAGWFTAPGLADGLDASHPLAQEEVFGPLAVVLAARNTDEAIALVACATAW